jgi:hypothetical protein
VLQLANARKEYEAAQLAFSGAELSADMKLAGVMRAFKVRGPRPLLRYISTPSLGFPLIVRPQLCMYSLSGGRIPAVDLWGPVPHEFKDGGYPYKVCDRKRGLQELLLEPHAFT